MLRYLLDENISPVVADGLARRWLRMQPASVHSWRVGSLLATDDDIVIRVAFTGSLTLVTFDVTTIPPVVTALAQDGVPHAGIVFVNSRTIPQKAHGLLIRALGQFWMQHSRMDWRNRIAFLPRPKG